ncbi:hypothetical protein ICV00_08030 [Polynucleobacter asymbioticus]|nr:hypothetical protein ICV00_08030 [Polynucleobacter asymbioticus]
MTKYLVPTLTFSTLLGLTACTSMDKLQARLEADPQCPPVMNAKTGALMPCPTPPKPQPAVTTQKNVQPSSTPSSSAAQTPVSNVSGAVPLSAPQNTASNPPQGNVSNSGSPAKAAAPSSPSITANPECKGVLHQKTGALMPCPNP